MALASVALVFRAFADPTRLRILHLLAGEGEICVGDLVAALRVPQPTASRHLAYLRRAGVVGVRKDGLWSHYSLARARTATQRAQLLFLRESLATVAGLLADRRRLAALRRSGGCCPADVRPQLK